MAVGPGPLESLVIVDPTFWRGKRVFLTGHTGFKGAWMSLWLQELGAEVTGFALAAPTQPSLFESAQVSRGMNALTGDIRDAGALKLALRESKAEIVIHMAAQALVRQSYIDPTETYSTNVMGLVNLFEAIRQTPSVRAVVNVTSDKCYENREWPWAYRENEAMGGHDPYSSSKGCAELITSAYQRSYFMTAQIALASARAGNVIGGGDWATDRLIPDVMRAMTAGRQIILRNPDSIRPWQHVLAPLSGYLILAQKLFEGGSKFDGAWNFGPVENDTQPVRWIVDQLTSQWGMGASWKVDRSDQPHEANLLKLDSSKARTELKWQAHWNLAQTVEKIIAWYKEVETGVPAREATLAQVTDYTSRMETA